MKRFLLATPLLAVFLMSSAGIVCAEAAKKVRDPFMDRGMVDAAVQSSQHFLYSPLVSFLLFFSITGIFVGLALRHGKTTALSLFISTLIVTGRYFSETIFSSFQFFQISFIGPVFILVLFGKFISTYLSKKANAREEAEDKKTRERYHHVQARSTLRQKDSDASKSMSTGLNPITGQSQSKSTQPSAMPNVAAAGGVKLTRPF